jgi:transcriptional regulator with XRE-family HTH domain
LLLPAHGVAGASTLGIPSRGVEVGDEGTVGVRLRRMRRERGLTQERLAELAGLSVAIVQKLEQGRRSSARTDTLIALANALDTDLSQLVGKRPRLDRDDDVKVLALRDALLHPALLTGPSAQEAPQAVEAMRPTVVSAWEDYWAGRFSRLVMLLPGLIADARAAHGEVGAPAAAVLGQAYQLAACVLVHLGKDDLAAVAAERGVAAATTGNDELQWATIHGTYAWTLLHQGRTEAAEQHAMWVAGQIEPSLTASSLEHLAVWGGVVLWAMAAAVAGGRRDAAVDHLGLARSASGRFEDGDRHDYNTNFGPTQVAMQATHAYAVLREPARALNAATTVRRDDLFTISYGRHLLDVAQAQVDARDLSSAVGTLVEADELSSEWFRHQGPARSLVGELVQESRRLSPPLRRLARTTGIEN